MDNPARAFATALKFTLRWEGGYVDDPHDPGGATNFGITQATYDRWLDGAGGLRSVRNISLQEVSAIYFSDYWKPEAATCQWPLSLVIFDTAVQFGRFGMTLFVQEALPPLEIDGVWGPKTAAAVKAEKANDFARAICEVRRQYRHLRVKQRPSQQKFLQGWLNRDAALLSAVDSLFVK